MGRAEALAFCRPLRAGGKLPVSSSTAEWGLGFLRGDLPENKIYALPSLKQINLIGEHDLSRQTKAALHSDLFSSLRSPQSLGTVPKAQIFHNHSTARSQSPGFTKDQEPMHGTGASFILPFLGSTHGGSANPSAEPRQGCRRLARVSLE